LPFYAILRAIPNKIGGVIAMLSAILVLFILPSMDQNSLKSPKLRLFATPIFILFVLNFFMLGILGGSPAEEPFITLSRISTVLYFSHFLIIIPVINKLEKHFATR